MNAFDYAAHFLAIVLMVVVSVGVVKGCSQAYSRFGTESAEAGSVV